MPPKAKTQLSTERGPIVRRMDFQRSARKTTIAALGLKRNIFATFFPKDETGIFPT